MANLNARVLLRSATSAEWADASVENAGANLVLLNGEVGIEKCDDGSKKIKIGDGISKWSELDYATKTEAEIDAIAASAASAAAATAEANAKTYADGVGTAAATDAQTKADAALADAKTYADGLVAGIPTGGKVYQVGALTEITGDKENGDMAIVTTTIASGKVSRTAYVWDASLNESAGDWVAFDGNYNASNVYFDSDFTFTVPVGVVTQAQIDAGNGSVERAAEGQNMQSFFGGLFAEIVDPTITDPNLGLSLSKTSVTQEVGTTYEVPKATATLSTGSYSYGTEGDAGNTATGIVATNIKISDNKVEKFAEASNANTVSYTISSTDLPAENRLVTDAKQTIVYSAECSYPASTLQPINNIKGTTNANGETYVKIAAGTDTASATFTINGFRKMFMGPIAKTATLNSATIRAISASSYINKQESKTAQEFTAPVGTERMIVAFRKDYTTATPTFEYFTMSYESFAGFKRVNDENGAAKTVLVSDARGGENGQVEYIVYECTSNALEAATKFKIKLN